MAMPRLSVIVPNWRRGEALERALAGLRNQRGPVFEVVVVSDRPAPPAGVADVKWVMVSEPNVSRARNLGLRVASGDWIAFLDDDAVPEPDWLEKLSAHAKEGLGAVGGPVLAPGGVRVQWGRLDLDDTGSDVAAGLGLCPKLSGTNLLVSRAALSALGGFDERFAYFHDDTDLTIRLHRAGYAIRWAADAVVHHGYLPSDRRGARGVPRSLSDVGHSTAAYLATHVEEAKHPLAKKAVYAREHRRLCKLHRLGLISARRMWALLAELSSAMDAHCAEPQHVDTGETPAPFTLFNTTGGQSIAVVPRIYNRALARADADRLAQLGHQVTLVEMRYSPRKQRVAFNGTYWHHLGGTFAARPAGGDRPFRLYKAAWRELLRVAPHRGFDRVLTYSRLGVRRWLAWDASQNVFRSTGISAEPPADF